MRYGLTLILWALASEPLIAQEKTLTLQDSQNISKLINDSALIGATIFGLAFKYTLAKPEERAEISGSGEHLCATRIGDLLQPIQNHIGFLSVLVNLSSAMKLKADEDAVNQQILFQAKHMGRPAMPQIRRQMDDILATCQLSASAVDLGGKIRRLLDDLEVAQDSMISRIDRGTKQ